MRVRAFVAAAAFASVVPAGPSPVLAMDLSFQKTWGGTSFDRAEGVAVAPDGHVYVVGVTSSFGTGVPEGDSDAFILKYTAAGAIVWQRTYGVGRVQQNLPASDHASDVAVAADGSVYFVGGAGAGGALIVKFTPDGNLAWDRRWSTPQGEVAEAVAVAPDGAVYVTGNTQGLGAGMRDAFLLKLAPDGTLLWQRTWGGAGFDEAREVAVAADGTVFLAGDTNSFSGHNAIVVKFASDGTLLWEREWRAGTVQDMSFALGVAAAPDGGAYITGAANLSGTGQDIFVARFGPTGDLLWDRTWGAGLDAAHGVVIGSDGYVFVTGNTGFGQGNGDAFLVRFRPDGQGRVVANTWGGADNESGQSIAASPDGRVYIAGAVSSSSPYVFEHVGAPARKPDAFLGSPQGTVTMPALAAVAPGGSVLTPQGSETFAGAYDGFLIKVVVDREAR